MLMPLRPFVFATTAVPEIQQNDFDRMARILHGRVGIVLGMHKREMAARTLAGRVRELGLSSVAEYLNRLEQHSEWPEWQCFINIFTINHTAFFRERHHFSILAELVRRPTAPLAIWCCAASTGEEAYSIAMTLRSSVTQSDTPMSVWATDVDTNALEQARRGVYAIDRVAPVSEEYLKQYFYRGKGAEAGKVRVKPIIRKMIHFEPVNLLSPNWPAETKFDAIFCRNTMIYFDKPTQTRILERFAALLKPGGLLFAGHSESFTYLTKAFHLRGQTVYVKAGHSHG